MQISYNWANYASQKYSITGTTRRIPIRSIESRLCNVENIIRTTDYTYRVSLNPMTYCFSPGIGIRDMEKYYKRLLGKDHTGYKKGKSTKSEMILILKRHKEGRVWQFQEFVSIPGGGRVRVETGQNDYWKAGCSGFNRIIWTWLDNPFPIPSIHPSWIQSGILDESNR